MEWWIPLWLVLNVPVYLWMGWLFFDSWDGFVESLRYAATPDIISAFRGEYWDDRWEELKMFFFIGACGVCLAAEYLLLRHVLGWWPAGG